MGLTSVLSKLRAIFLHVAKSHVQFFATLWTVAHQAPLSMEFTRQEYWSGCHFLLQEIFQTQGLNPRLLICCISCIGRQIPYSL